MLVAPHSVGILGGMGPAAGADFVRLFVEACTSYLQCRGEEVSDQSFPEHWLVQMPIPDRSSALHQPAAAVQDPAPHLLQGVGRLAALGVRSVAVACNTAHAWHERLQQAYPQLQVLHIARVVANNLRAQGHNACMLLATQGTYRIGLYDEALAACGITVHLPQEAEREQLMRGIYQGVKADKMDVARSDFAQVASRMRARHGDVPLIMGCTEIPLALPGMAEVEGMQLVDPAWELAQALARVAYVEVAR